MATGSGRKPFFCCKGASFLFIFRLDFIYSYNRAALSFLQKAFCDTPSAFVFMRCFTLYKTSNLDNTIYIYCYKADHFIFLL